MNEYKVTMLHLGRDDDGYKEVGAKCFSALTDESAMEIADKFMSVWIAPEEWTTADVPENALPAWWNITLKGYMCSLEMKRYSETASEGG